MTLFLLGDICVLGAQLYVIWMIAHKLITQYIPAQLSCKTYMANPRMALWSFLMIYVLEFCKTAYDINGPGDHFPLRISVPVLVVQSVVMLRAL